MSATSWRCGKRWCAGPRPDETAAQDALTAFCKAGRAWCEKLLAFPAPSLQASVYATLLALRDAPNGNLPAVMLLRTQAITGGRRRHPDSHALRLQAALLGLDGPRLMLRLSGDAAGVDVTGEAAA